jgi:tetratricopeptide (TPR) repeat protein
VKNRLIQKYLNAKTTKAFTSKLMAMLTGEAEGVASTLLAAGKYREAQELYKLLLKREDTPEIRNGLAQCYLHRALAAAKNGKLTTAVILWEKHKEFSTKLQNIEHYLSWLIKSNQHEKIKDLLASMPIQQLLEEHPPLAELLGFFYVSGVLNLQHLLPANSVLTAQGNTALAVLTAYAEHDREQLKQRLKKIPYRSAYRNFGLLIKAALFIQNSPAKAQTLLSKIPATSPYHHAAWLVLLSTKSGNDLLTPLLSLQHQQQLLVSEIQNWNPNQIKFLQDLKTCHNNITAKTKFNLAIAHQALFGNKFVQRYCYALLPEYPAGMDIYEELFAKLDQFTKTRIAAQHAELCDQPFEAIEYWRQCLKLLSADPEKKNLQIALILRHIADISFDQGGNIDEAIESLQYDPENRETYAKIIDCFLQDNASAQAEQWLQQAIQKFPGDVAFVTQAMLSEINQKSFARAGELAQQLLAIDPLNIHARDTLFHNHLAHARQLIKTNNFQQAAKAIRTAEELKLGTYYQAMTQLLDGLLMYTKGDHKAARLCIDKALHLTETGDFIARYRLINEALQLGLPLPPLLHLFPVIQQDYIISSEEMTAFTKLVERQQKEENHFICKSLDELSAALKKSIRDACYSSALLFQLCRRLDQAKHFELLCYCSQIALQRWPEPRWTFYKLYADVRGDPKKLQYLQLSKLQIQFAAAKVRGDTLAATLISQFIDKHHAAAETPSDEV